MNSLPNELLVAIFKLLPLADRASYRCVSKRFKTWVDDIKLNDLVLSDVASPGDFAVCWCGTSDRVNLQNLVSYPNLKLFRSICFPDFVYKQVRRLRMVAIQFKVNDDFNSALNRFNALEQLELGALAVSNPKYEAITLPHLKTLRIEDAWLDRDLYLYLELPKLHTFYAGDAIGAIDGLPETIKYLEIVGLDSCDAFKYLKALEIVKSNLHGRVDLKAVSYLLNLRTMTELHFAFDNRIQKVCGEARTVFNHALQHLASSNCRLFFNGVRVLNNRSFEQYGFAEKDPLSLHLENPQLLTEGNYTQLEAIEYDRVPIDKIPNGFLRRYPNVQSIFVNSKADSDELLWFLRHFRSLSHLVLKNTALGQPFLDQVPTLNCSLFRFEFYEKAGDHPTVTLTEPEQPRNTVIDFAFLLRLDYLQRFVTNLQLSDQIAADLFSRLDHFTACTFLAGEKTIEISKVDRFRYTLVSKQGKLQSVRKGLCHRQLTGLLDYFVEQKE